jgi:hypothetical protein
MGVRLYNPAPGRLLSVDPVPGGSCGSYKYVRADAVNQRDTAGTCIARSRDADDDECAWVNHSWTTTIQCRNMRRRGGQYDRWTAQKCARAGYSLRQKREHKSRARTYVRACVIGFSVGVGGSYIVRVAARWLSRVAGKASGPIGWVVSCIGAIIKVPWPQNNGSCALWFKVAGLPYDRESCRQILVAKQHACPSAPARRISLKQAHSCGIRLRTASAPTTATAATTTT